MTDHRRNDTFIESKSPFDKTAGDMGDMGDMMGRPAGRPAAISHEASSLFCTTTTTLHYQNISLDQPLDPGRATTASSARGAAKLAARCHGYQKRVSRAGYRIPGGRRLDANLNIAPHRLAPLFGQTGSSGAPGIQSLLCSPKGSSRG